MQAITIAIGKNGLQFFTDHYLRTKLLDQLRQLSPPDKYIWIDKIGSELRNWTQIDVRLTNGRLTQFTPSMEPVVQQENGAFSLHLTSGGFDVQYDWKEKYGYFVGGRAPSAGTKKKQFTYNQPMNSLSVVLPINFTYNGQNHAWEITSGNPETTVVPGPASIPGDSVLQHQHECVFSSHVDDATAQSISAINLGVMIDSLFAKVLTSIPDSGDLGDHIAYDFSLGDSGLAFPNNDGIQMGVKGGASYNGAAFSETPQPSLPLPVPPADTDSHHLNMYVSNYEVDALNWAYYKAGKLNLNIQPAEIPDPASLKVSTYTALEPSLKPYSAFVMYAQIVQNTAPVTSFQTVYLFPAAVMTVLQGKLPGNVYQLIQGLAGGAYLSQADLEAFLTSATVSRQYFTEIENASKTTAMVLTQDMNFSLQIQNGQPKMPEIDFRVQRVDVMTNLGLGIASNNKNQTLQFGFANASNTATFISSTVPGFNGKILAPVVWPVIAEPMYAQTLVDLGKTGAPLPIMQGFQFDFDKAVLSVQDGYVSILASVLYKS